MCCRTVTTTAFCWGAYSATLSRTGEREREREREGVGGRMKENDKPERMRELLQECKYGDKMDRA